MPLLLAERRASTPRLQWVSLVAGSRTSFGAQLIRTTPCNLPPKLQQTIQWLLRVSFPAGTDLACSHFAKPSARPQASDRGYPNITSKAFDVMAIHKWQAIVRESTSYAMTVRLSPLLSLRTERGGGVIMNSGPPKAWQAPARFPKSLVVRR
jgi:hypothetical protein